MSKNSFLSKVYSENTQKLLSCDKYTYSLITIKCPISFYYKYVKGLDLKSEFVKKGISYHSAISKVIKGEKLDVNEREFAFDVYLTKQALRSNFKINFKKDFLYSEEKLEAKAGDYQIYGILDLFYFVDNAINVIDFKYAYNSPYYKSSYKTQGMFYSYLLFSNFQDKANFVYFYNYYKFSNEFIKLYSFSVYQKDEMEKHIVNAIDSFRNLILDFSNYKNCKNNQCEFCMYKTICEVYNAK